MQLVTMPLLLWLALSPAIFMQRSQPGAPRPPGEYPAAGTNTTPPPKPSPPELPKGWREASDDKGLCQWAVPANWHSVNGDDTRLKYGRGDGRATLRVVTIEDWEKYKDDMRDRLKPAAILDDTAQRFWVRFGEEGLHYQVALKPTVRVACVAEFHLNSEANLKDDAPMLWRMANSVKRAPAEAENPQTR